MTITELMETLNSFLKEGIDKDAKVLVYDTWSTIYEEIETVNKEISNEKHECSKGKEIITIV